MISEEKRKDIVERYRKGQTFAAIGQDLSISSATAYNSVRELAPELLAGGRGKKPLHRQPKKRECACGCGRWFRPSSKYPQRKFATKNCPRSPEHSLIVSELKAGDRSYGQIGKRYFVSRQRIGFIAKQLGMRRRVESQSSAGVSSMPSGAGSA